jgi:hypothetical protein
MTTSIVVFTMGGKGGAGKTGVTIDLASGSPYRTKCASLKHLFHGSVTKANIHTPAGLDVFVDHLEGGARIILADVGAGSGQVTADRFDSMYEHVAAAGVSFIALGVVTLTR